MSIRTKSSKYQEPLYPQSLLIKAEAMHDEAIKTEALKNAIPEVKRSNIIENDVEDVC